MKKENLRNLIITATLFISFALWTLAVKFIDLKAIGPESSVVGFATVNQYFHRFMGVHMHLYAITDWLGLVPIFFVIAFGILGLIQWIKRKNIMKVDFSILILGGFYILVMILYFLFEILVINYRPVLIAGNLEPSYPSSTTLLVLCVIPTAIMQLNSRIKNHIFKKFINIIMIAFILFMVIGRLISGVHWLTDIIGGVMLSSGLVMLYLLISNLKK